MVKLSFELGSVGVARSFPIFNIQFFHTRLLVSESLDFYLLAVGQVAPIEVLARLRSGPFGPFLGNY